MCSASVAENDGGVMPLVEEDVGSVCASEIGHSHARRTLSCLVTTFGVVGSSLLASVVFL